MIPWLITQQFQEDEFGLLSGIAMHPDYARVSFFLRLSFVLRLWLTTVVSDGVWIQSAPSIKLVLQQ